MPLLYLGGIPTEALEPDVLRRTRISSLFAPSRPPSPPSQVTAGGDIVVSWRRRARSSTGTRAATRPPSGSRSALRDGDAVHGFRQACAHLGEIESGRRGGGRLPGLRGATGRVFGCSGMQRTSSPIYRNVILYRIAGLGASRRRRRSTAARAKTSHLGLVPHASAPELELAPAERTVHTMHHDVHAVGRTLDAHLGETRGNR